MRVSLLASKGVARDRWMHPTPLSLYTKTVSQSVYMCVSRLSLVVGRRPDPSFLLQQPAICHTNPLMTNASNHLHLIWHLVCWFMVLLGGANH